MGHDGVRRIAVVTVGRSDYGICQPLLQRIRSERNLKLCLFVAGMHLSEEFGMTVKDIEADGHEIAERVAMLANSDEPTAIAESIGRGVIGFAKALKHSPADLLVVVGDRFEMFSAAVAALPQKIPVAHIHGGEITEGAIDDAMRHSITKLSHLHFVSTDDYARRVIQMGEEPWRVTVSGAPGLDNMRTVTLLGPKELKTRFGLHVKDSPFLVTFHPVTLEYEKTEWHICELLAALGAVNHPTIFTMPNADTYGRVIRRAISEYVRLHSNAQCVESLGTQGYLSLMACSVAMVGNSSSGIIEAPSFKLPVVNVGSRQHGRVRAANVIDVGHDRSEILAGIQRAIDPAFRQSLSHLGNPYGDGTASELIVKRLMEVDLNERLLVKRFHDVPQPQSCTQNRNLAA